jgi:tetratricopeptide (TPR) repeat protein
MALGGILAARNDVDEAIVEYNQAVQLNPRSAAALTELARLKLRQRQIDEAEKLARQALRADAGSVAARLALVQALLAGGNIANAEQEIKPFDRVTDVPEIVMQRGFIALARNDSAKAAAQFEQALKLAPDSVEALSGLVAVKLAIKKPAEAEAAIDARLAKHPDDPQLLVLAARAYTALGKKPRAEEALRHTIEKDPANLEAYSMLGTLYAQSGQIDQALAQYESMAKAQPKSVTAHTMVGTLLIAQNKTADARRSYQRALDLDPNAAVAANNLAWLQAEAGENLDVALDLAQVAKRQLPDSPSVNDTLGWIYLKKGLNTSAIPFFEQAIAKDPKDPVYHYHLGLAHAEAGNAAQSRASYERALAIRGDFPGADAARKALGRPGLPQ